MLSYSCDSGNGTPSIPSIPSIPRVLSTHYDYLLDSLDRNDVESMRRLLATLESNLRYTEEFDPVSPQLNGLTPAEAATATWLLSAVRSFPDHLLLLSAIHVFIKSSTVSDTQVILAAVQFHRTSQRGVLEHPKDQSETYSHAEALFRKKNPSLAAMLPESLRWFLLGKVNRF